MEIDVFEKVINIAIKREIEAYDFYTKVAEKLTDKGLNSIFTQLAGEEQNHRNLLESLKQDAKSHFKFENPNKDFHLAEKTELPPLSTDMKPADAFALAMKKEQQAAEFYHDLANRTEDAEIKEMCTNLAHMELQHKQKVEKAYVDVAYVESF